MYVRYLSTKEFIQMKDCWDEFNNCKYMTPFQYFNWQCIVLKEHNYDPFKVLLTKLYYAALLSDESEIIAIAPFYIKRVGKKKGIYFLGSGGGVSDYSDFIYSEKVTRDDLVQILEKTLDKFNCKTAILGFFWEGSKAYQLLVQERNVTKTRKNSCVKILLPLTFEEYLASLSKNTRQNIRTAKNRLEKEKKLFRIEIFDNQLVPIELAKSLQSLYLSRFNEKNSSESVTDFFKITYRKFKLSLFNAFYTSMTQNTNSFTAILYIDNYLAAFCHGLKSLNGDIYVMQVAIDLKYTKYSPGILQFCELIKELYVRDSCKSRVIDLTSGDERYKFALGGVEHYSNEIKWYGEKTYEH